MKWIVPDFYPDFHCIGGSCIDNCCIGWEIDIDTATAACYKNTAGPFGERLHRQVDFSAVPHFILTKQDRCPFLNSDNLCDIYSTLGEDALCEICREHPRFHEWFGPFRESGIGLACPEAAALLFRDEKPLRFISLDDGEAADAPEDADFSAFILQGRQQLCTFLRDRARPFYDRLQCFLNAAVALQDDIDGLERTEKTVLLPTDVALLNYATDLEPLNEEWSALLEKATELTVLWQKSGLSGPNIHTVPDWMLEKTADYLAFRWLGKAVFDGDLWGKALFIARFIGLLQLFVRTGCCSIQPQKAYDVAEGIRLLSKQLEYLDPLSAAEEKL